MRADKIRSELNGAANVDAAARHDLGGLLKQTYHVECFGLDGRLRWEDTVENLVVTVGLNYYLSRVYRGTGVGGAAGGYHDGRRYPTAWVASTAYSVGDVVRPTSASGQLNNNRFFIVTIAGTSAASEPTWPSTAGGTVVDNTVTWMEASQTYVGLVTGPGSGTTFALADTMASHAGWTETVPYSNADRPAFTPAAPSAGSLDNSAAKAVFNINATATVAGSFVSDFKNKSGTTGLLIGAGDFTGGDRAVQNGDTLNVTVTASLTSS